MSKQSGPNIFRKSLLRELVTVAAGTFLVLVGISVTTQLVRLLGQAAAGSITSVSVVAFLGFSLVNYLPVLLSLTVFIAVLLALSRSYRDSEMVVWFSSGLGLTDWIRPVLAFAVPLVLVIALLTLTLTPWAVSRSEELRRTRPQIFSLVWKVAHEAAGLTESSAPVLLSRAAIPYLNEPWYC